MKDKATSTRLYRRIRLRFWLHLNAHTVNDCFNLCSIRFVITHAFALAFPALPMCWTSKQRMEEVKIQWNITQLLIDLAFLSSLKVSFSSSSSRWLFLTLSLPPKMPTTGTLPHSIILLNFPEQQTSKMAQSKWMAKNETSVNFVSWVHTLCKIINCMAI